MKSFRNLVIMAVLATAVAICMSGCTIKVSYKYDNADKYTAGDREITDEIRNIEIDYLSGDVSLAKGGAGKVTVKETTNKEIDDAMKVHTYVDGGTLYVKYCASGKGYDFNKLSKKLEITVPDGTDLDDLKLDVSAGDIDAECSAKDIFIDASAGDVTLTQKGESDSITIDASAGDVKAEAEKTGSFTADMSAGSGEFRFAKAPADTSIDASAGDIKIYLPEKSDITVAADISAGDFSYELPFTKKGDDYICGSGADKMKIDASAGNVSIKVLK